MILEMLVSGAIGNTLAGAYKSIKMDEKALQKYAKAYEKSEEAKLLIKSKSELTDKRLMNVIKKKTAIKEYTIPRFAEVYHFIRELEIENSNDSNRIKKLNLLENATKLDRLNEVSKIHLTDQEYIFGSIFLGLGGVMVKDSERFLSAAKQQASIANVQYSQAENIVEVLDAIEKRADRISKVLFSFNYFLSNILDMAETIISQKGKNFDEYTDSDFEILLTCENIAAGLADVFEVPVIDQNGEISEAATKMLLNGEDFLNNLEKLSF